MDLPDFLTRSSDGNIVVPGRRIRLYDIVREFNDGQSAEMICLRFAPMPLAMVYKVIGFYLDHRAEVDAYVQGIRDDLDRLRASGNHQTAAEVRARIEARAAAQHRAGA